jgi:hypothetical protein
MPKIIGQDQSVYKRATCQHCGAINEYTPKEVQILWKGKDISGTMEVTKGFSCGQCGDVVITQSS